MPQFQKRVKLSLLDYIYFKDKKIWQAYIPSKLPRICLNVKTEIRNYILLRTESANKVCAIHFTWQLTAKLKICIIKGHNILIWLNQAWCTFLNCAHLLVFLKIQNYDQLNPVTKPNMKRHVMWTWPKACTILKNELRCGKMAINQSCWKDSFVAW